VKVQLEFTTTAGLAFDDLEGELGQLMDQAKRKLLSQLHITPATHCTHRDPEQTLLDSLGNAVGYVELHP